MICKFCNVEIEDGTAVCPVCGKELVVEEAKASEAVKASAKSGKGLAIAGLVMAIVAVPAALLSFVCLIRLPLVILFTGWFFWLAPIAVILAIVSFVLTGIASGKAKKNGEKKGAAAIFAIICGIAAIVLSVGCVAIYGVSVLFDIVMTAVLFISEMIFNATNGGF